MTEPGFVCTLWPFIYGRSRLCLSIHPHGLLGDSLKLVKQYRKLSQKLSPPTIWQGHIPSQIITGHQILILYFSIMMEMWTRSKYLNEIDFKTEYESFSLISITNNKTETFFLLNLYAYILNV